MKLSEVEHESIGNRSPSKLMRARPGMRAFGFIVYTGVVALASVAPALSREEILNEAFLFTPPGFAQEGHAVFANGDGTGVLQIRVRDAVTGQLVPCRVNG